MLPGMEDEVSQQMKRILTKQGMTFRLGTKVAGAKATNKGVALTLEPAKGGAEEKLETDVVLLSIGRRPYTDGLGLKESGVALDDRGRVVTDAHFTTNVAGVYARGDAMARPTPAHQ